MARREKREERPLNPEEVDQLIKELEPCYIWTGGKPEFQKPRKGSVPFTACQTPDCTGFARHETNKFMRLFWPPNSFYCRSCRISRGLIVTALTLLVGLFVPLSLPTFGFWTTLCIFLLLGGAIIGLPPWLMKTAK